MSVTTSTPASEHAQLDDWFVWCADVEAVWDELVPRVVRIETGAASLSGIFAPRRDRYPSARLTERPPP